MMLERPAEKTLIDARTYTRPGMETTVQRTASVPSAVLSRLE